MDVRVQIHKFHHKTLINKKTFYEFCKIIILYRASKYVLMLVMFHVIKS